MMPRPENAAGDPVVGEWRIDDKRGERRQSITPEQWAAEVAERRRIRDAKRAAERDKAEAAHCKAFVHTSGLRRAVLELHRPTFAFLGSSPACSSCYDGEYGADDWPCETYVLARDFPGGAA